MRRAARISAGLFVPACALATLAVVSAIAATDEECLPTEEDTVAFCGDGGHATKARLAAPYGVARLPGGGFLVADSGNNRVRRISSRGRITTVAGTGSPGFAGDGGRADRAKLSFPTNVAVAPGGGFYVADSANNRVRRISPSGRITTVAGTGTPGFSGDGGAATGAALSSPTNVAVSPDGGFLVADNGNQRIRRVTPGGVIATVAGTGRAGFSGDGGPALLADLNLPAGVVVTPGGDFLIADSGNNRVRHVGRDGRIVTIAGTGAAGARGNGGPAIEAELAKPTDISLSGSTYLIADTGNQSVRRVSASGRITRVAGTGTAGFSGDRGPAVRAELTGPTAVAAAGRGFLIADNGNRRIRSVSARGRIVTAAGMGPTSRAAGRLAERIRAPARGVLGYFDPHGLRGKAGRSRSVTFVVTKGTPVRVQLVRGRRVVRRTSRRARTGFNSVRLRRLPRAGRYNVRLFIGRGSRPADSQRLVVRR